jgi:hypothetical protein
MWWLAFVGPVVVVIVYVLTGGRDRRREAEVERWRRRWSSTVREVKRERSAYRSGKEVAVEKASGPGARRVSSLPGPLARMLENTGGGQRLDGFELVPKLAYLAVMGSDPTQGSDHVTVLAKLDEAGPTFTVRPLPIVEGARVPNTGVQFKKDPDFMAIFLVEPTVDDSPPPALREADEKAIRKWLSPPVREALGDFPAGWLRVDGNAKTMALTLYGPTDADGIDELVATADIVFAEHGAGGGASLLPAEEAAPKPPPKKKAAAGTKPAARG